VKRLAGRIDAEDALQRLEKVTVEEARMAAAEALKATHGVGNKVGDGVRGIHDAGKAVENKVRDVEGMIQGVGNMLQGVDGRVKGIGDMAIIGAPNMFNLSSLFLVFIPSGVGRTGRQMTDDLDDLDAMGAEHLKTANDVDNGIEVVDNKTQGLGDILEVSQTQHGMLITYRAS
jgi:hypothetical protein